MTETLIHLAMAAFLFAVGVYNVVDWQRKRMARRLSLPRPKPVRGPDGRWRAAS
jgi:hypothetical protein